MIQYVQYNECVLAIIISGDHREDGIHFLTDADYSQQLAYMNHPKGKIIDAHIHNHEERNIILTQEVLVIRKGSLRVDFYKENQEYIESYILRAGDIILLASGGHGFEALEDLEMVEIKQGPYLGEKDKTRFPMVDKEKIVIREHSKCIE